MKKLFALLLALCLLIPAAFAESDETVYWSDVEETLTELGFEGDFVSIPEVGLKVWVPAGLNAVELTEDDLAAHYVAFFTDEDGEALLSVSCLNEEDLIAYDDYVNLVEANDGENIGLMNINDLTVLRYVLTEQNSLNYAVFTDDGKIVEFVMWPYEDEANVAATLWGFVAISIQAD